MRTALLLTVFRSIPFISGGGSLPNPPVGRLAGEGGRSFHPPWMQIPLDADLPTHVTRDLTLQKQTESQTISLSNDYTLILLELFPESYLKVSVLVSFWIALDSSWGNNILLPLWRPVPP